MYRGSADYANRDGAGAVSKRNRLSWTCSASTACDSVLEAESTDNGALICEVVS